MKTCYICQTQKPLTEFYKSKRTVDGHEGWCKTCRLARNKKWVRENKDRHNELTRQWYINNREQHLLTSKKHYDNNKSDHLEYWYARNERTKKATPSWADRSEIRAIYAEAKRITEETGIKHHVDHIIPLRGEVVCGLHVSNNMQIIPADENLQKAAKFDPDNHYEPINNWV